MENQNRFLSRRGFLGLAGATAVVMGMTRSGVSFASDVNIALGKALTENMADVDIVNYALTLELLEAELYRVLNRTGFLSGKEAMYVQEFGAAEAAHVEALIPVVRQLGGTPATAPAAGYNFPQVRNRAELLSTLATVEEVGVGAYQGQANRLQSKDLLAAAGGIMQVEARHAAVIRTLAGQDPVPAATTKSLSMEEVLRIVTPFLAK